MIEVQTLLDTCPEDVWLGNKIAEGDIVMCDIFARLNKALWKKTGALIKDLQITNGGFVIPDGERHAVFTVDRQKMHVRPLSDRDEECEEVSPRPLTLVDSGSTIQCRRRVRGDEQRTFVLAKIHVPVISMPMPPNALVVDHA